MVMGAIAQRMGARSDSLARFLVTAIGLGFFLLLLAGVAATLVTRDNQRHVGWVGHTYQVELAMEQTQLLVEQTETTRRGYILTGAQPYLDAYRAFDRDLGPALTRLTTLTRDNARQQHEIAGYRRTLAALRNARERTIALIQAGRREEAHALFAAETAYARPRALRETVGRLLGEEHRLLTGREAEQRRTARIFYVVVGVAGMLLALLIALTALTVSRFTRDLNQSHDLLRGFNDTLEEEVRARTADLVRANEEIQRFAYIVSHDLRSPLVNVMGFTAELEEATGPLNALVDRAEAEAPGLLTDDAKLAARVDLPEAIGFIRSSTQKMDRLINAILKLSREGRRTITPEPLDAAEIADGAVAALRRTIDERGIAVTVERPMPTLVSDRLAVEQILSNLIENATKYLQPGRAGRITVSGATERDRVVLSVADNGRGIAPADHQRVFDLFRRSGAQDQPGEGIGLAHVRALAYRLGGTIDLDSTLEQGSTFRLVLPATYQEAAA